MYFASGFPHEACHHLDPAQVTPELLPFPEGMRNGAEEGGGVPTLRMQPGCRGWAPGAKRVP
jgi:hypothetical protein